MMLGPPPQCVDCLNWRPALDDLQARRKAGTADIQICTAYMAPPGIPDEIWAGLVDHRIPYTNDHGVQWTPLTPETEFPEDVLNLDPQLAASAAPSGYTDPGPEASGEARTFTLP